MGKGAGAATSLDARGGKFRCMIEDMASKTLPRLASRWTLRTLDKSLS